MKWISVEDRLPGPNENVLVCNAQGVSLDEREPVIAYFEDRWVSIAWWDYGLSASPIVTHWMPLPPTNEFARKKQEDEKFLKNNLINEMYKIKRVDKRLKI